MKKILLFCLAIAGIAAFIIGGATSGLQRGDCVEVSSGSVHAYYEPAFESALVGWFVEGEELNLRRVKGDWWLVAGQGIDAGMHHTRMTGWVQASYMERCD